MKKDIQNSAHLEDFGIPSPDDVPPLTLDESLKICEACMIGANVFAGLANQLLAGKPIEASQELLDCLNSNVDLQLAIAKRIHIRGKNEIEALELMRAGHGTIQ